MSGVRRVPVVKWLGKPASGLARKDSLPAPPLELVCSAVLELPPDGLRTGLVHFKSIGAPSKGQEQVPFLTITETFLGSLVRVRDELRPQIEQLLRGLMGEGFLREKARTKILQTVENLAPVRQVWRDILLFTDKDHFMPDIRSRVKWLSRGAAAPRIPMRSHFGTGAWQGAAAIVRGKEVVAYADYIERSPFVSSIGVFTDPEFRGQGFGMTVVSAAAKAILRSRRIPIYCADVSNTASLALARRLGYVKFGEDSHFFS